MIAAGGTIMLVNHRSSALQVSVIAYSLLLPLTGLSLLPAQTPPDPSSTECSVKGTVTDAVTGQRLRKVYMRLAPNSDKGTAYLGVTDDQGEFVIQHVASGTFRLSADKQGYRDGHYGGDADVELRLTAGQNLSDLHIALTPQAAVSGRILDDDGEPWNQANASIYRSVLRKGKRELERMYEENADDRGVFRIASLSPGRYYLAAEPNSYWEDQNLPTSVPHHQTTWYPSSAEAETATPIVLAAGESRDDIEIRLRRGSFFHIRGSVTGLNRIPPSKDPEIFSRRHVSATRISGLVNGNQSYTASLHSDGSFEFPGVLSGSYELQAVQGTFESVALGETTVRVDGQDLDNVSIGLVPPHPLKGVVQLDSNEPFDPAGLSVSLRSVDNLTGVFPATVRSDGSFEFAQVGAERYRVFLRGTSSPHFYYLKRLRYGDTESPDRTFSAADDQPLTVIVSARGGRLAGAVKGATELSTPPQVVLIPDSTDTQQREEGTHEAVFDQFGAFSIEAIAPGDYHLYAFEKVPDDAWEDPDFLQAISGQGVAVHFEEGDAKRDEVPLIRQSDLAPVLARLGIE